MTEAEQNEVYAGHKDYRINTELRALIPLSTLQKLTALLDSQDVTFGHTESHFYAHSDDWNLTSRLLTGQFPNWEAVLPKASANRVTLSSNLKSSVARIASFADERSHATKWELIPGTGLRLSASNSEFGDASETITAVCDEPGVVGLSAQYVSDILGTLDKEQEITLAMRDAQSATLWTPVESNGYTTKYVLMPMRL